MACCFPFPFLTVGFPDHPDRQSGIVFDVSSKRDVYGPGGSYHVFAGKDGSKGLGLSSLKVEDAIPDYSSLKPTELKVLDDWVSFFTKRYNIIGQIVKM